MKYINYQRLVKAYKEMERGEFLLSLPSGKLSDCILYSVFTVDIVTGDAPLPYVWFGSLLSGTNNGSFACSSMACSCLDTRTFVLHVIELMIHVIINALINRKTVLK